MYRILLLFISLNLYAQDYNISYKIYSPTVAYSTFEYNNIQYNSMKKISFENGISIALNSEYEPRFTFVVADYLKSQYAYKNLIGITHEFLYNTIYGSNIGLFFTKSYEYLGASADIFLGLRKRGEIFLYEATIIAEVKKWDKYSQYEYPLRLSIGVGYDF